MSSKELFQLVGIFSEHESDVRALALMPIQTPMAPFSEPFYIVSSSRDRSVRVWSSTTFECLRTLIGHEHFVGAVCTLDHSSGFPEVVSGANDRLINVWDVFNGAVNLTLVGHEGQISALEGLDDGRIVSGSWDGTARVWLGGNCQYVLTEHTATVWAVLGLAKGRFLTGSADKTIKIWAENVCIKTLVGHTDCVRGLTLIPNFGFASTGNDCSIIIWNFEGDLIQKIPDAHSSFIYHISCLPSGQLLTVGEDRTLKIWNGGICMQTIAHPSTVWNVLGLPNGEIVTACSNGSAYVWSSNPERFASLEQIEKFENSLSSQPISMGNIDIQKLPGQEALERPGKKDGENKVIRVGTIAYAYQWSEAAQKWNKIGEVVTGPHTKQEMGGKFYDHIFDVDLGDGRMRQLGYNNGENPYTAAQNFLWSENLNQGFLDQVAQFIVQNTQQFTIGQGVAASPPPTGSDPFTGSNRYVPKNSQPSVSQGTDPFTGGSRYIPKSQSTPTPSSNYFPVTQYLFFDTINFGNVISKIKQTNASAQTKISEIELNQLDSIAKILQETNRFHATTISSSDLELLLSLCSRWPISESFPFFDILRILITHPEGAQRVAENLKSVNQIMEIGLGSDSTTATQMLCFRFFANTFKFSTLRAVIPNLADFIFEKISDYSSSSSSPVRLAISTILINFSLFLFGQNGSDAKIQCTSLLSEMIKVEKDEETLFRSLVALATLGHKDPAILQLFEDLDVVSSLQSIQSSFAGKVKECVQQIFTALK